LALRIDGPRAGDTVLHLTARSNEGSAIAVTGIRGSPYRSEGQIATVAVS
jgi:hypothetical protein